MRHLLGRTTAALARCAVVAAALFVGAAGTPALAQYSAPASSSAAAPSSSVPAAPAPPSATAEQPPKPPPGPALRERGASRRRGNPASGAFMGLVLVGGLLYWVVKRIRR